MISDDCLSVLDRSSRVHIVVYLGNVDKGVDVGFVPLHVLVLDQPLDLLLHTIQTHIYRCSRRTRFFVFVSYMNSNLQHLFPSDFEKNADPTTAKIRV